MQEGVAGLLKDKTRPSRKQPLSKETVAWVVELTLGQPNGEVTHWTAPRWRRLVAFAEFGAAHLAQPRPAAPPVPEVQTLERPQVH